MRADAGGNAGVCVFGSREMPNSPRANALRDHFLGWQCRIRQIAMRREGGRPSPGMRPRILATDGREIAPAVTMLIISKAPEESTAFFRFQVQKSNDTRDIYDRGLAFLQADYFQEPGSFDGRLVAVFSQAAGIAAALVNESDCVLEFEQFRQSYSLTCRVAELFSGDAAREAALWHNRIFNPALPDDVRVLAFQPDWEKAEAAPPPLA
jgi:hypothetical protein